MFTEHSPPPASAVEPQGRQPEYAENWALFLDVDGTLLDLAAHPDAVSVDPELMRLLRDLRLALGGALALITGRSVAGIDALFAPEKLPTAGQHGVERRDADGRLHHVGSNRDPLRSAAAQLRRVAEGNPGLLIEDKGMSIALHFRQAPELAGAAFDAVSSATRMLGSGFELQTGKMVFEIKPSGHDKGTAIESFLREAPFRTRPPVFVGDDLTDEYGFEIVNRLGGHSIKVGGGKSAARWRIGDAGSVRAWLRAYLAFLVQP